MSKKVNKKQAAKKVSVAKKKTSTKPTAKKTSTTKKAVAKKVTGKKVVAKKVSAKKVVAKKVVAKKAATKKVATPTKKTTSKKVVAKKATSPAKKAVAKKIAAPAKKAISKTPVAKKEVIKKMKDTPVSKPIAPPVKAVAAKKPEAAMPVSRPVVAKAVPVIKKNDTDNRTRYSDAELQEFKEIILEKLDASKKELAILAATLSNPNDNGTDDTAGTFKVLEDGSATLEKEHISQMASRQKKFIENLEAALIRIENKTYGICRETGKLIPKERLRAVPHTTLSMEAKMKHN